MKKHIGIDLGGMSAKGAVLRGDTLGKVYTCITSKENTPERTADALAALVKEIVADIPSVEIAGLGIGSPGIVDSKSGTVISWENFGWKDVPLARMLQRRTGIPTTVLNDANAATLGEYAYGAAKKYNSAVMLTLGTGVGSGIVKTAKYILDTKVRAER